ncbi:Brp/Blh family beta-carotene 15,15'-dioxygenase [Flavobacterium sp.]|jgi:Brp/Blh family beta-carotene 15,15'-monooxygenase|uniref:Brp/Blh family beta-carotene 15,15'-dioxygenase n=1 Tax=Flavobacterium sp. TaxID=239 RepID=UPI0037BF7129
MTKFVSFLIIASFLGLWLKSFFSEAMQTYVGFILIFSFGILHGANDLLLIVRTQTIEKVIYTTKILLYYCVVVVLGAILFYFIPLIALSLFILVSGYHFGQQHWQLNIKRGKGWIEFLFQLNYGLLILALLFIFHEDDVQRIINDITGFVISSSCLHVFFYLTLFLTLVIGFIIFSKNKEFKRPLGVEFLLVVILAILFQTSTLIWGFALYFIIWHSIPSIKDQINFLYGSFTWHNFKLYFRSAALYWLVSLLGIALLYFLLNEQHYFDALFFAFLAAITFPHVWVITQMFKSKRS